MKKTTIVKWVACLALILGSCEYEADSDPIKEKVESKSSSDLKIEEKSSFDELPTDVVKELKSFKEEIGKYSNEMFLVENQYLLASNVNFETYIFPILSSDPNVTMTFKVLRTRFGKQKSEIVIFENSSEGDYTKKPPIAFDTHSLIKEDLKEFSRDPLGWSYTYEDAVHKCPTGKCCSVELDDNSRATGWTSWVTYEVDCSELYLEGDGGGNLPSGDSGAYQYVDTSGDFDYGDVNQLGGNGGSSDDFCYTCPIDVNIPYEGAYAGAIAMRFGYGDINSYQNQWLFNPYSQNVVKNLFLQLLEENNSERVLAEVKLTIETLSLNRWEPSTGKLYGKDKLEYYAKRQIEINGTLLNQYLLKGTNDVVSQGIYRLCSGCSEGEERTYYYRRDHNKWFEYRLPGPHETDVTALFEYVYTAARFTGRYILPIEDAIILIDGKDFDGVEQSREEAAVWLLLSFIPGGKGTSTVLKPVASIARGAGKGSKYVVRQGSTFIVKNFDDFINVDKLIIKLRREAVEYAGDVLGPYKPDTGGHHPFTGKAFEGDDFYDYDKMISVSPETLGNGDKAKGLEVHRKITGRQISNYKEWAKNNKDKRLTLEEMAEIELKSMTDLENLYPWITKDRASYWVLEALEDLKQKGVKHITNIPWVDFNFGP